MASDDIEGAEVDRLVTELAHPPKRPARRSVFAALVADAPEARTRVPAPSGAPTQATSAPGRTWTTSNVMMPAARTIRRRRFVLPSRIRFDFSSLRKTALDKWKRTPWSAVSVRMFVGLGVLLGAAMPYWPYAHAWSWGLVFYLCSAEMVVVTGIWGAKLTWDTHLPAAHTVAVGTTIWGLGLMAVQTIPRIAYVYGI